MSDDTQTGQGLQSKTEEELRQEAEEIQARLDALHEGTERHEVIANESAADIAELDAATAELLEDVQNTDDELRQEEFHAGQLAEQE